jgi:tetratricopeptide (TPR) repeat protein
MKTLTAVVVMLLGSFPAFAQMKTPVEPKLSPAQQSIERARNVLASKPNDYEAYNALALALSRRARETSDPVFYTQAEEALQKSFAISPGNFDGARIQVWLLLGKHEFAAALDEAIKLNKKIPDDIMIYGFLTDANVELGRYKDAETSAQWMLNLRGANVPSLTRAAYLRELFGDNDGAVDLMEMALQSVPPGEVEDRAWITTQTAHLKLASGKAQQAEQLLQQALGDFPNYHYALGNLAKVRIQQKRYDEAVALYRQRYDAAPHAENLYDLAEALQLAGKSEEATAAFAEFERKSLAETRRADNSNHELVFYYADHAHQPQKALEVAQREFARRQDVFTLDCYSWALFANGKYSDAQIQIQRALSVGIQDVKLLRHAGEIALKVGDTASAQRYLRQAAELSAPDSTQTRAGLESQRLADVR